MNALRITTSRTLVLLVLLALPFMAHAEVPPLTIEWQSQPLFQNANFLPGDTEERYVRVTNNTEEALQIVARTLNVSDPNDFGAEIDLVVRAGEQTVYSGTFTTLFETEEILLSTVSPKAAVEYRFAATFKPTSVQKTDDSPTLSYDLQIKASSGSGSTPPPTSPFSPEHEGDGVISRGGFRGGSQDGVVELAISNVDVILGSSNTVSVVWETNLPSTSQVVYGATSGGPYAFNLEEESLGYSYGTEEIDSNSLYHNVPLEGLEMNETYVYRVVSRLYPGGLQTVSHEGAFTLVAEEALESTSAPTAGLSAPVAFAHETDLPIENQAAAGLLDVPWMMLVVFLLLPLGLIGVVYAWSLLRSK